MTEQFATEAEEEIDEAAKEQYGALVADAAAALELEVKEFGPFLRTLARGLGSRERYPDPVQYVFYRNPSIAEFDAGDVSEIERDTLTRSYFLVIVDEVTPATMADLTRSRLLRARFDSRRTRPQLAVFRSFTIEALRERWQYRDVSDVEIEPAPDETSR